MAAVDRLHYKTSKKNYLNDKKLVSRKSIIATKLDWNLLPK